MTEPFEQPTANSNTDPEPAFGEWLNKQMETLKVGIPELAAKSGITYTGIWNIVKGYTKNPLPETRQKLTAALNVTVPAEIERHIEQEDQEAAVSGYEWRDFTPLDLATVPDASGVYVFYDITDRPVYVGKSARSVRGRIKDHQTRFWFKEPLVVRGSFLALDDPSMCAKIESILIKFLGNHALLNARGVVRDMGDVE